MGNKQYGLIDNWLRHIKDVYRLYEKSLDAIEDVQERGRRLVELNVIEQVGDLSKTTIVQNAWDRKQPLHVHGWVYDLHDGIINDLNVSLTGSSSLHNVYKLDNPKS
jgi:carbonic anhydrase